MWRENAAAGVSKKTQPSAQPVAIAKPSAAVGARSSGTGVAPVQRVFRGDHKNAIKPLLEKAIAVEKIPAAESPVSEASGESPAVVDPPSITASLPKKDVGVLSGILNAPENLASPALATSEGVTPARLEHRVEPIYPGDAKRLHIEGPVVLRATIDEKGSIQSLDVVKGSPLLAKAAVEAVRKWRYRPSELNHRFVPSTTDITVVFHLK
jgi:TonB family protein